MYMELIPTKQHCQLLARLQISLPVYYQYYHGSKEARKDGWQNEGQAVTCDRLKNIRLVLVKCKVNQTKVRHYQVLDQLFSQVVVYSVQLVFLE